MRSVDLVKHFMGISSLNRIKKWGKKKPSNSYPLKPLLPFKMLYVTLKTEFPQREVLFLARYGAKLCRACASPTLSLPSATLSRTRPKYTSPCVWLCICLRGCVQVLDENVNGVTFSEKLKSY